jgi:hypothetical protein
MVFTWGSLATLCMGCSTSTCDRSPEQVVFCGGTVRGNFYESSAWDQGYLYFPPARTIHFLHKLQALPAGIEINLAFDDHGFRLAPTAGNQAIIEAVTVETIDVKNDTCSDFYIRLSAERPVGDGTDGAAGAAGSSGADDNAACASP